MVDIAVSLSTVSEALSPSPFLETEANSYSGSSNGTSWSDGATSGTIQPMELPDLMRTGRDVVLTKNTSHSP